MNHSSIILYFEMQESSLNMAHQDMLFQQELMKAEETTKETAKKKLVDYTISSSSTRRRQKVDETATTSRRCLQPRDFTSTDPTTNPTRNKVLLPSFKYVDEILHSSSEEEEERVDFFLRVKKIRPAGTKMHDFPAGLEKARARKSLLFGSFLSESGARRSSYVDLKEARSNGRHLCVLTF